MGVPPPAGEPALLVGHQDQGRRLRSGHPRTCHDAYFKRAAAAKKAAAAAGKKDGDIFEAKKESYKPSEQRKADQQTVDKSLMEALKKHADAKLLKQYIRTGFGLSKGEYPHKMVF